jgi:hypothetical protein
MALITAAVARSRRIEIAHHLPPWRSRNRRETDRRSHDDRHRRLTAFGTDPFA